MSKGKDLIKVVLDNSDEYPQLVGLANEYKTILEKLNKVKIEYFSMDERLPKKEKLGKDIFKMQNRMAEILKNIKEEKPFDPRDLASFFRGVAGRCLPIKVYSQLLDYANKQLKDHSFEPPLINILTAEEEKLLNDCKKIVTENDKLKVKIYNAKKSIQDLMPNFIGNIDPSEYKRRIELTKSLNKIIREL